MTELLDYSSNVMGETPSELRFVSDLVPVGKMAKSSKKRFYAPAGTYGGIGGTNSSTVRIQLNSNGFLNVQDGVLVLRVNNPNAYPLYLDSSAHSLIDRLSIYSPNNGNLETIERYNVLCAALSDVQVSNQYRCNVGSSLMGYTGSSAGGFIFGMYGANNFNFNAWGINASAQQAGTFTTTVAPGLVVGRNDGDIAGNIRINGTLFTCVAGTATNVQVSWNGITFAGTGLANQISVDGTVFTTSAAALPRVLVADREVYNYALQSESIPANSTKVYRVPLMSGLFNINKYIPTQFLSSQGITLELLLAPTSDAFFEPSTARASLGNHTITDIYYECPVVMFEEDFNMTFRQLINENKCKFHAACFQTNSTIFTVNGGTYSIGSKQRSLKSIFAIFRPASNNGQNQLPKISRRILPSTSFSYQWRIGTTLVPEQPVRVEVDGNGNIVEISELYSELLKSFSLLSTLNVSSSLNLYNMLGIGSGFIGQDCEVFSQNSLKLERSNFDTISNNLPFQLEFTGTTFAEGGVLDIYCMSDVIFQVTSDGNIIRSQ